MASQDSLDIKSLISYIDDVKPFRTKLTDVSVEYQHYDNVSVGIHEQNTFTMRMSSVWELTAVSDGVKNRYRLPATCFPRRSGNNYQWIRTGVTDELPNSPGSYHVPYNNGLDVYVNGILYTEGVEYTLVDPVRDHIQFTTNYHPLIDDEILFDLITMDKIYIEINGVWKTYTIAGYDSLTNRFDPYNDAFYEGAFGIPGWDVLEYDTPGNLLINKDQELISIGFIRVLKDANDKDYFVFEFNTPPVINTNIKIRVKQSDVYHDQLHLVVKDDLAIRDISRHSDSIHVDIALPFTDAYDIFPFDTVPLDHHDQVFKIIKTNSPIGNGQVLPETSTTSITDNMQLIVANWPFPTGYTYLSTTSDGVNPLDFTIIAADSPNPIKPSRIRLVLSTVPNVNTMNIILLDNNGLSISFDLATYVRNGKLWIDIKNLALQASQVVSVIRLVYPGVITVNDIELYDVPYTPVAPVAPVAPVVTPPPSSPPTGGIPNIDNGLPPPSGPAPALPVLHWNFDIAVQSGGISMYAASTPDVIEVLYAQTWQTILGMFSPISGKYAFEASSLSAAIVGLATNTISASGLSTVDRAIGQGSLSDNSGVMSVGFQLSSIVSGGLKNRAFLNVTAGINDSLILNNSPTDSNLPVLVVYDSSLSTVEFYHSDGISWISNNPISIPSASWLPAISLRQGHFITTEFTNMTHPLPAGVLPWGNIYP